jgi:hypothetical protein
MQAKQRHARPSCMPAVRAPHCGPEPPASSLLSFRRPAHTPVKALARTWEGRPTNSRTYSPRTKLLFVEMSTGGSAGAGSPAGGGGGQRDNVYAQLLADADSVAPARSKVTEEDLDFEPASRHGSTAEPPSSPPASRRESSWRSDGSRQEVNRGARAAMRDARRVLPRGMTTRHTLVQGAPALERNASGPSASEPYSPSGSLTARSFGEVVARDDGRWGFAYPTKNTHRTSGARGEDSGQRNDNDSEKQFLVQVEAVHGAGLGPGWTMRTPRLEVGSGGGTSPRKGPRSSVSFGKAGYGPVHRLPATKLDIGDLEDVDEDAPFQSALEAEVHIPHHHHPHTHTLVARAGRLFTH